MIPISTIFPDSFFSVEERDNTIISEQTKKIWAVEMDLLVQLDNICKENNLHFCVDCGTLLGAVRHKGYIPWDDDVDVVMLREDYDKLVEISGSVFQEPYFFQCFQTDLGFTRVHAQLRNSKTTGALACESKKVPFNQGIFLDIFPLDRVSKYKALRVIKYYLMKLIIKTVQFANSTEKEGIAKQMIQKLIKKITVRNGHNILLSLYDHLAKKCWFPSDLVAKVTFYPLRMYKSLETQLLPRMFFKSLIRMPFEFIHVPVPKEYDKVLKVYYGENYMEPVKGGGEHGEVIFDPERPYKEVIKELKRKNEV